jgi:hypothetical protein
MDKLGQGDINAYAWLHRKVRSYYRHRGNDHGKEN